MKFSKPILILILPFYVSTIAAASSSRETYYQDLDKTDFSTLSHLHTIKEIRPLLFDIITCGNRSKNPQYEFERSERVKFRQAYTDPLKESFGPHFFQTSYFQEPVVTCNNGSVDLLEEAKKRKDDGPNCKTLYEALLKKREDIRAKKIRDMERGSEEE